MCRLRSGMFVRKCNPERSFALISASIHFTLPNKIVWRMFDQATRRSLGRHRFELWLQNRTSFRRSFVAVEVDRLLCLLRHDRMFCLRQESAILWYSLISKVFQRRWRFGGSWDCAGKQTAIVPQTQLRAFSLQPLIIRLFNSGCFCALR